MHHLLVNTNQDIKRRYNQDKDLIVYTTEHQSKRNPTVNPWLVRLETQHQVITLTSIDKSLVWNRH